MSTATCWRAKTSSDYLFHVRRWRRWWSNEKTAEPVTTAQACVSAFVSIKLLNIFDVATFSKFAKKWDHFVVTLGLFLPGLRRWNKLRFLYFPQVSFSLNVMSPTFTFVFPVVQWFKQSTTILQTDWYKPINLVNSICLYNITLCTVSWGGRRTLCSQLCLHVIWNIQQLCCWQYLNTFPFLSCFKHT